MSGQFEKETKLGIASFEFFCSSDAFYNLGDILVGFGDEKFFMKRNSMFAKRLDILASISKHDFGDWKCIWQLLR